MRTERIISTLLLAALALPVMAQTENILEPEKESRTITLGGEIVPKDTTKTHRFVNHLIAPKGEWQCGIAVMYADFDSDNSEYMLLAQNMDASASFLRIAPEAAYTFMPNHAVGIRFAYTTARGVVDAATADLLGNFSMTVENVHANSRMMSACVFERSYVGLDQHGRVGLFMDYCLSLSRTKSQVYTGSSSDAYTINKKIHVGVAPGLVYYPMNNISVQASIGIAGASYGSTKSYSGGEVTGSRAAWNAKASLSILDLNLGLTIHL